MSNSTASCSSAFEEYNHTELYQACKEAGIPVRPNEARETMIAYLVGDAEPSEVGNIFDEWRVGIQSFLQEHRKKLETQLTCPAKNMWRAVDPNPNPCFGCIDAQVCACIAANPHSEDTIRQLRRTRNG